MINHSSKYKRISLLIDEDLLLQFQTFTQNQNQPDSVILRDWIYNCTELKLFQNTATKNINHTFRLDSETLNLIAAKAKAYGISKSDFLRLIILNKINGKKNFERQFNLKALWDNREFSYILELTQNNLDILSSQELLIVLKTKLKQDDFKDILYMFSLLRKKTNYKYIEEFISLTQAEIMVRRRDVGTAHYVKQASEDAVKTGDKKLFGKAYFVMAKLFDWTGENIDGVFYCEKALEYLDENENPLEVSEIYIYLIRIYDYRLDLVNSELCINKLKELVEKYKDPFIEFKLYSRIGYNSYTKPNSNIQFVEDNLNKGIKLNKSKFMIPSELRDAHLFLGRIQMGKGNFNEAYKQFNKSKEYELMFKSNPFFSSIEVYKLYLESFSNYENSIEKLNEIIKTGKFTMKMDFVEYFLNLAKFQNHKGKDVDEGISRLKKITSEGSYNLVKSAALNSLKTKKIQPLK